MVCVENSATGQNTADAVGKMLTTAYGYDIFAGAFYFEFSDEWYKSDQPAVRNKTTNLEPNTFPNKYRDNEAVSLLMVEKRG